MQLRKYTMTVAIEATDCDSAMAIVNVLKTGLEDKSLPEHSTIEFGALMVETFPLIQ